MSDMDGMDAFNNVLDRLESYAGSAGELRSKMEDARSAQREAEREVVRLKESVSHLQIQLDVAKKRIEELTPRPGVTAPPPPNSEALAAVQRGLADPKPDIPF